MGMEVSAHQVQNFNDDGVADRVEHLISGLAIGNKLLCTQHREMLRDIGLLHAKLLNQFPGGELSIAQELKNGNPSWVSERLKYVSLEPPQ